MTLLLNFNHPAEAWNTPGAALGARYTAWTWSGLGGNANWDNGANWCGAYINGACRGQSGGPPSSATVVFSDLCTANCNPTLNVAVDVRNLILLPSYSGTIFQGALGVTVRREFRIQGGTYSGGSGALIIGTEATPVFAMTGGTFLGGTGNVTVGTSALGGTTSLTGGTFTSTSGTFLTNSNTVDFRGLTAFNHNTGRVRVAVPATGGTNFFPGTGLLLFHLDIIGTAGSSCTIDPGRTIDIDGNLTLGANNNSSASLMNGTLNVRQGDVYRTGFHLRGTTVVKLSGTGTQTVDSTAAGSNNGFVGIEVAGTSVTSMVVFVGSFQFTGGFISTDTLGGMNVTAATIIFHNHTLYTATYNTGPLFEFPAVNITAAGAYLNIGLVRVHDLTLGNTGTSAAPASGTIRVSGNITGGTTGQMTGDLILELVGSGDQTVDVTGSFRNLPSIRLNNPSGIVSFVDIPRLTGTWTHVAGSVNVPTTLEVVNNYTPTINSSTLPLNNLVFTGTGGSLTLTSDLTVLGDIAFEDITAANPSTLIGSTFTMMVEGDITAVAGARGLSNPGSGGARILLAGPSNQLVDFSLGSTFSLTNLVIAAGSNTVTFLGTINFLGAYTHTSGTVVMTGTTVNFVSPYNMIITPNTTQFNDVNLTTGNASVTISGQPLVVLDDLQIGSTSTTPRTVIGAIEVYGDMAWINEGYSSTATLTLRGNNSTLSRASDSDMPTGLITVAKNAGQVVTLLTNFSLNNNQNMSVTSGQVDIGGAANTLTLSGAGALSLAVGTSVKLSGGILSIGGSSISAGPYSLGSVID